MQHLRRKTPCVQAANTVRETHGKNDGETSNATSLSNDTENDPFERMRRHFLGMPEGQKTRTRTDETSHCCQQCNARFNQRSNLSRHVKNKHGGTADPDLRLQDVNSSNTDRVNNLERELEKLKDEIRKRPTSVSYTTTHNNNNNNNFNINALGYEDTSVLTPEVITKCIKRTSKGVADLVEKLHFDATANRNLRATLQFPEQVEYYDGKKWKYGPRDRIVRQLVDNGHNIMSEHYDTNAAQVRSSMTISLFNFVQNWMHKMDRSNARAYEDAMKEVYCCVLNRSREVADDDDDDNDEFHDNSSSLPKDSLNTTCFSVKQSTFEPVVADLVDSHHSNGDDVNVPCTSNGLDSKS